MWQGEFLLAGIFMILFHIQNRRHFKRLNEITAGLDLGPTERKDTRGKHERNN